MSEQNADQLLPTEEPVRVLGLIVLQPSVRDGRVGGPPPGSTARQVKCVQPPLNVRFILEAADKEDLPEQGSARKALATEVIADRAGGHPQRPRHLADRQPGPVPLQR